MRVVDASVVVAALIDSGDAGRWAEGVRPLVTVDRRLARSPDLPCRIETFEG